MKFFSTLKWVIGAVILALFFRVFFISVYRVPTNSMEPAILTGELIIANQLAYGFKLPWMVSGYFESEPQIGDIVAIKMKNKMAEEYLIKRITEKASVNTYVVRSENQPFIDRTPLIVNRDQILSRAWFVWFSMSTTQDSISSQKSFRWKRFLTRIQ